MAGYWEIRVGYYRSPQSSVIGDLQITNDRCEYIFRKKSLNTWKLLFFFLSLQRIDGRTGAGRFVYERHIGGSSPTQSGIRGTWCPYFILRYCLPFISSVSHRGVRRLRDICLAIRVGYSWDWILRWPVCSRNFPSALALDFHAIHISGEFVSGVYQVFWHGDFRHDSA